MSLPEEVLNFDADDEAEVIDLTGDKRRIRKRDSPQNVRRMKHANFKFLKEDEADPWTETSDESYDGTVTAEIRQELGIYDAGAAFQDALVKLGGQGWRPFLQHPYIQQLFGPAEMTIYNFNNGAVHRQVRELWNLKWDNQLSIHSMRRHPIRVCYLCNLERRVCYTAKDMHGGEVYLGPDCYDNRFSFLIELVDICYNALQQWRSDIDVKMTRLLKPIDAMLWKIAEGNKRMAEQYE
jgi:hypothetical protein